MCQPTLSFMHVPSAVQRGFLFVVVLSLAAAIDYPRSLTTKSPYVETESRFYTAPPRNCQPIQINLISRHGTRNPTYEAILHLDQVETWARVAAKDLKNSDFDWLQSWKNPYKKADAGYLISRGKYELYNLSKRAKENFDFIALPYHPQRFFFGSSYVARAMQSGVSFSYGLFEAEGELGDGRFVPVYEYTQSNGFDPITRFYSSCEAYRKEVEESETLGQKVHNWKVKYLPRIADNIISLLGLPPNSESAKELPPRMVWWLWTACAYDISVLDKSGNEASSFCQLFTKQEDVDLLEYFDDLQSYYFFSYGYDLSWKMATPLLDNFITAMKGRINGSNEEVIHAWFGHMETVTPFYSLLGLFQDDPPLSFHLDPFSSHAQNRKFRTSEQATYASNTQLILYQCSETKSAHDRYLVKVLHNEREESVPGCSLYCPFDKFLEIYQEVLSINWQEMCSR